MRNAALKQVSVSFNIDSSAIIEHARLQVLSKDWRGALKLLIGTDPEHITMELALGLLEGRLDMKGSTANADMCIFEADPKNPQILGYLDTLGFQYAGLYREGDNVYQPEYKIGVLGPEDYEPLLELSEQCEWYDDQFLKARILHYANETRFATFPTDRGNTIRMEFRDATRPEEMAVIWKQVSDYPLWITPHTDPYEAIEAYVERRTLQETGAWSEVLDKKRSDPKAYAAYLMDRTNRLTPEEEQDKYDVEDMLRADGITQLRKEIIEKAGPQDGEGWLKLPIYKLKSPQEKGQQAEIDTSAFDRFLLVPKLAFYKWSLDNVPGVELGIHDEWRSVCPTGMKMPNDNPYHSDWVIGAGLDLDAFYDKERAIELSSYHYRMEVVSELASFDFIPLSKSDRQYVSGKVRLLQPGETLKKGQIGVIPHAGVEYDAALRSASQHKSALICATGGKLAHLAVVGREMNVPVVMWEKAMTLTQFHTVSLNLREGRISFQII